MNCSRCGAQLGPNMAFCGACGASVGVMTGVVSPLKRPAMITVLAVLHFIGAALWLLVGLLAVASLATGTSAEPTAAIGGLLLTGLGLLHLACGIGLLKLRSYGRTIQLIFARIGLLGFPIGTIISILILVQPGNTGTRYFATDARGIIFTSSSPIRNPIVESAAVVPIQ